MQVTKGRYQTKNARLVEITGFRTLSETRHDGTPWVRRVWDGMLFKADGKTVDAPMVWEDSGQAANQRGVASQFDLAQAIGEHQLASADQQCPFCGSRVQAMPAMTIPEVTAVPAGESPAVIRMGSVELTIDQAVDLFQKLDTAIDQLERPLGLGPKPTGELLATPLADLAHLNPPPDPQIPPHEQIG